MRESEASAEDVERAWADTKLAQVLYHDWEAKTYDDKWSISFDERCISYARDRFSAVAGTTGWPYGTALEVGAGTGFFRLGWRWSMFAYKSWLRLSALDRHLARVVPAELFYNVSVTGVRPAE